MTKAELIAALARLGDNDEVYISVEDWDEPLNVTGIARVDVYGDGEELFGLLSPGTLGATRLDPNK